MISSLMTLLILHLQGEHLPLQGELLHEVAHVVMLELIKMARLSIGVYQRKAVNMILQYMCALGVILQQLSVTEGNFRPPITQVRS